MTVDEPTVPTDGGLVAVRVRLDLGYDGTDFSGWARQPPRRPRQGPLERADGPLLRQPEPPQLTVAGRPDAGEHARRQVAHVDLPGEVWAGAHASVVRRLAGILPPDLRVWRAVPAPAGFDARFSPLARRYAYRIADAEAGVDPLRRRDVLWHRRPLDLAAMGEAAGRLVGEHDFAAYCRRREGATTVRELLALRWERAEGGLAVATIEADAFCHNMVRALVGALVAVGEGRRDVRWPQQVLARGVRDPGVQVMPAHGLTLEAVRYPDDADLAARATATRRVRVPSSPRPPHPTR
jgi:tRNA pseudouridine38-40 synthase